MLGGREATSSATRRNGGHVLPGDWKNIKKWIERYGEDEALKIQKLEQKCVDDIADFVQTHNVLSSLHEVETAEVY
jgi:ribosomal protein S25